MRMLSMVIAGKTYVEHMRNSDTRRHPNRAFRAIAVLAGPSLFSTLSNSKSKTELSRFLYFTTFLSVRERVGAWGLRAYLFASCSRPRLSAGAAVFANHSSDEIRARAFRG